VRDCAEVALDRAQGGLDFRACPTRARGKSPQWANAEAQERRNWAYPVST
jgi:hypothetical protein